MKIFEQLIEDFDQLPKTKSQNRLSTFLGISGYPHYENVISNILAFYFDVSEQHGLNDLFIKSLLGACNENSSDFTNVTNVEVYREYQTKKYGRIDLLVRTDEMDIIIENKVYAPITNDLADYYQTIESENQQIENNKEIKAIVLSLSEKTNNDVIEQRFEYVTYKLFFAKVQEYIGAYMTTANSDWLVFLKNLFTEVDNLRGENKMENPQEIAKFFSKYSPTIIELAEEHKELMSLFQKEANQVLELWLPEIVFKVWSSSVGMHRTMVSIYHPISKDVEENEYIHFEIVRCLDGWEIIINANTSSKFNKSDIQSFLDRKGISILEDITSSSGSSESSSVGWLPIWTCTDEITPEDVAKKAKELFDKIRKN
jgi:hypothetical protein